MIGYLYPMLIIVILGLIINVSLLLLKKLSLLQFIYLLLFSIYISGVISVVFFPFPVQKELIADTITDNLGEVNNFIPFKVFCDQGGLYFNFAMSNMIKQVLGNIILFIPLGFFISLLFKDVKLIHIFIIGFLCSLSIELLQGAAGIYLGFFYRSMDIDDIIFNTLGATIGYYIFWWFKPLLKSSKLLL